MRAVIILAGAAGVLLLGTTAGGAAPLVEGPWCAVYQGRNAGVWRCDFWTLEACTREVIAGNRGFCNHNPAWLAAGGPPQRRRSARHM